MRKIVVTLYLPHSSVLSKQKSTIWTVVVIGVAKLSGPEPNFKERDISIQSSLDPSKRYIPSQLS